EAAPEVTFVATLLGPGAPRLAGDDGHAVPTFRFPEDAVHALGRLATYRSWRRGADRFESERPVGCDDEGARRIVDEVLARRGPGDTGDVQLDHDDQER